MTNDTRTDLPLVTIAIPSFNHRKFIGECIESILAQTYENIELVIIDDGSEDNSAELIATYFESCTARLTRYEFITQKNQGLCATLNTAIEWSRGKYFMGIASDDSLEPLKTSLLVEYLEREDPNVAGVFGGATFVTERGVPFGIYKPVPGYYGFDDIFLRERGYIITVGQLLRTDVLKKVGGYADDVYIEDLYMWLLLTSLGYKLRVVPELVAKRRLHTSNISGNVLKMYEGRLRILGAYKSHPNYELVVARVTLSLSLEYSSTNKMLALRYLNEARRFYPRIVLDSAFIITLARFVAPGWLLKIARLIRRKIEKFQLNKLVRKSVDGEP